MCKVAQYWEEGVGWKWELLSQVLSSTNLVKLTSIALRPMAAELDRFGWLDVKEGRLMVKSAYRLARGWVEEERWVGWNMVWKLRIRQRIKVFLWVLSQGKLLTNLEMWKRRMTANLWCARCGKEEESTLHAIRYCWVAKEVWERIIPPDLVSEFLSPRLRDWVL